MLSTEVGPRVLLLEIERDAPESVQKGAQLIWENCHVRLVRLHTIEEVDRLIKSLLRGDGGSYQLSLNLH